MLLLLVLAFATGAGLAAQGAINAELRTVLGAPVLASLVSFGVGAVLLLGALLVSRERLPSAAAVTGAPWWVWAGGVFGAAYVLTSVLVIPRAGAAATIAAAVAGQLVGSVVIDSLGLLGVARHALSPARVLGMVLLIGGALLVQRF